MRILHVISSVAPRYGGPSKAVVEMCRELARRGERAEIYTTNVDVDGCLDVPLERAVEADGVRITYFPIEALSLYKISRPLAGALRSSIPDFDVVHVHSLYQFPATVAAHYCRRYEVPYIVRPHGTLDPFLYRRHRMRKWLYEALWERRNLAAAAAVHFTAEEEMELASSLGLHFRGVVVPLGVDLEEPPPSDCLMACFWPETAGKKVILFLGRINFKKGLDVLARAFGAIARDRNDVHLLVAGPDSEGYGSQVRHWLREEGVLHKATFVGMLAGERKGVALTQSAIFVLPSYTENFGIAVVEAMAAGLPVVISNRVNIWREVSRGGAGIIVEPQARATADAMNLLLGDPAMAARMGVCGSRLAREHFTWESAGAKLVELYRQVVSPQLAVAPKKRDWTYWRRPSSRLRDAIRSLTSR
jgi:glycosyltransferase involved in cell wall biosynthesis